MYLTVKTLKSMKADDKNHEFMNMMMKARPKKWEGWHAAKVTLSEVMVLSRQLLGLVEARIECIVSILAIAQHLAMIACVDTDLHNVKIRINLLPETATFVQ